MEFFKYPKIYYYPHEENDILLSDPFDKIEITEKIDGGNGQFRWNDETKEVWFGSRSRYLVGGLENGQFREQIKWVKDNVDWRFIVPHYIYFFEYMAPHTLLYDFYNHPKVVGYDIYDINQKKFLIPEYRNMLFKELKIPHVKPLYLGAAGKLDLDMIKGFIGQSDYGNLQMEGVVVKNYTHINKWNRPVYTKFVTDTFKEKNRIAFNQFKKDDSAELVVAKYFTEERIRKCIKRLIDEGNELGRILMSKLINEVTNDVLQENILEISKDVKTLDFKKIRNYGGRKIFHILEQVIYHQGTLKSK